VNPITHTLVGWCLAEIVSGIGVRERGAIVLASVAPDLDGFGLPFELATRDTVRPLLWWSEYHHALAHNLLSAVIVGLAAALFTKARRVLVGVCAFGAFHLHLLCDLAGSRGPDGYEWPIPYLHPFSARLHLTWSGQWALNAWPNIFLTVVLLVVTFVLAWRRGYSPVKLFSARADRAFIDTLHARFPRTALRSDESPR
jgi:inner membrane protein